MEIAGEVRVGDGALEMCFFSELVYIPAGKGTSGGLFDMQGNPIHCAISYRGDKVHLSQPLLDNSIEIKQLPLIETAPVHFFVGEVTLHYGHFLLESTARLWPLLYLNSPVVGGKYLYCGANSPAKLFEKSFIKNIFAHFSLQEEDFVAYRKPCRIKNVFVAAPSFEIRRQANFAFRRLMRHLGDSLVADLDSINNINHTPLYLSKSRLTSGVSGIANEIDIENCLRKKGIDILYPETLTLQEQIKEISSRKYLLSFVGSALHTLLFCPGDKIISAIALSNKINANYIMIDQLCGNTGRYELINNAGVEICSKPDPGFMRTFYATDAERVADILVENILASLR